MTQISEDVTEALISFCMKATPLNKIYSLIVTRISALEN